MQLTATYENVDMDILLHFTRAPTIFSGRSVAHVYLCTSACGAEWFLRTTFDASFSTAVASLVICEDAGGLLKSL
jgi:hypothetical protein